MAFGFLNISHNFAGESQFIICEWVKSTAQGTPVIGHVTGTALGAQNDTNVTEVFYPPAHFNEQLQVTELPEVWMLVRFWRSSDGVAKDVLLLQLAGNARTGALYPLQRFEYVVDRGYNNTAPVVTEGVWSDPVQNDTGLRDTRLAGQEYWVEERGTGTFIEGELLDRTDDGGGFDFVAPGKVMNSEGVYVVYMITRIDAEGEDSGATISDEGVLELIVDQDYNPLTMNGKLLIANWPTLVGTLSFANLSVLADSSFRLQTHKGSQRNVVLQLDLGDTIDFRKEQVNKIILGEGEEIAIIIKDNEIFVAAHNTNHDKLGEVTKSYKALLNSLPGDGGSRILAEYPRVEELLDSLPASSVVNDTTWNTIVVEDGENTYPNRGKWMRDGANFRPPLLLDRYDKFVSTVDGSIAYGAYGHKKLMNHNHNIAGGNPDNGGVPYLSAGHSTGGNLGYQFNGSNGAPTSFRTGTPVDLSNNAIGSANNEVNRILFYPVIHI